ncbi:Mini-ribonuclease 3 [Peptococcus simiae]|uniref:Mini-ribonuclease 3 n=1 Tax=Peptococcus simiae TaxID=1643805 RepID=UPI00397F2E6C
MTEKEAFHLSALTLAWVGDAVYELHLRTALLAESHKASTLSRLCVGFVNHGAQSRVLSALEPLLTEKEAQILRRGRNANGSVPRGGNPGDYRRATGLEALVGYLYLSGETDRLKELFSMVDKEYGIESSR